MLLVEVGYSLYNTFRLTAIDESVVPILRSRQMTRPDEPFLLFRLRTSQYQTVKQRL